MPELMSTPVSLDEMKRHCRVDHGDEDAIMASYLDAATASVGEYLNAAEPLDIYAPAPVKSAILLMAAGLYAQREDIGDRQLYTNDTFARLLAPYRVY